MVADNAKMEEKEDLHHRAERRAVYVIIDAVFGLSLGLGAFSLTDVPLDSSQDLFVAVGFFGFSYAIIFMSWILIRPFCEDYVVYGGANMILFLTGFFIAVMPIPLRIILMQMIQPSSPELLEAAFMLYPICLSVITITAGILSFAFSKQSWKTAPWKDVRHLLTDGSSIFTMGFIFLLSAFMSYEQTIEEVLGSMLPFPLPAQIAELPFKVGFWFLGGVVLVTPVYIAMKLILRHMESKRKEQRRS